MRRIFISVMLMLAASMVHAADYDYLVFEQSDGNKTSVASENLIITFSNGYLIATASDGSTTRLSLDSMDSMWFSSTPTGVKATYSDMAWDVKVNDGKLFVTANRGERYVVCNAAGMVICKGETTISGESAISGTLMEGLYIVKIGDKSKKILVR